MENMKIAKQIRTAIKQGDTETVAMLIGTNKELLEMMTPFGTWLHVAASHGKLDIVKSLIELGADVNKCGGIFNGNPLNNAASEGHIEIVKYLLLCGAELDVSGPEKNPLFGAIYGGYIDIAKILIENGINTSIKYTGESMKDTDALAYAYQQGQMEIVKLLETSKENSSSEINDWNNQDQSDEIQEHINKYLGSIRNTITEIIPGSRVRVNIHIIPPSKERNFITLVTNGMSDYPMGNLEKANSFNYAELLLKLPSNWPINDYDMSDQNNNWPLVWLRRIAHIPHNYDGLLDEGVILPNGEPSKPFAANTRLSCIMVLKPKEADFDRFLNSRGNIINFYTLMPIYEEERMIALENGYEYLVEKFQERDISDVLDITRENVGL